jgi:hypothetical protein
MDNIDQPGARAPKLIVGCYTKTGHFPEMQQTRVTSEEIAAPVSWAAACRECQERLHDAKSRDFALIHIIRHFKHHYRFHLEFKIHTV